MRPAGARARSALPRRGPPVPGLQEGAGVARAGRRHGAARMPAADGASTGARSPGGRSHGPGSGPDRDEDPGARAGPLPGRPAALRGTGSPTPGRTRTRSMRPGGRRAHRLEPDPAAVPVVRWMFAQRLAGHSAARITRALNDDAQPGRKSRTPETLEHACGRSRRPPACGWPCSLHRGETAVTARPRLLSSRRPPPWLADSALGPPRAAQTMDPGDIPVPGLHRDAGAQPTPCSARASRLSTAPDGKLHAEVQRRDL